ncbi:uncharacterized protein LOC133850459 [Drosophila sulfurigaster albostrigata]|uniref:uncharacterized protein LOC133850459 n=1 Tax=Drosophila sulfurigaster albostrigata TaxID=89887 RepID=UPI002D218E6D|nr:uncharacterized protein LOC133850459 [Drosophila sulfurigaster albostrigata]
MQRGDAEIGARHRRIKSILKSSQNTKSSPDPNTDPDPDPNSACESDNQPSDRSDQWGASCRAGQQWEGGEGDGDHPIDDVECYVVTISKHFNWPIYRFNYVFMRNIESVIRKNTHRASTYRMKRRHIKRERED